MEKDFRRGCEVQKTEDLDKQLDPGKDERRFDSHFAAGALHGGHCRFRGDIAGPYILGEK